MGTQAQANCPSISGIFDLFQAAGLLNGTESPVDAQSVLRPVFPVFGLTACRTNVGRVSPKTRSLQNSLIIPSSKNIETTTQARQIMVVAPES